MHLLFLLFPADPNDDGKTKNTRLDGGDPSPMVYSPGNGSTHTLKLTLATSEIGAAGGKFSGKVKLRQYQLWANPGEPLANGPEAGSGVVGTVVEIDIELTVVTRSKMLLLPQNNLIVVVVGEEAERTLALYNLQ